MAPKKKGSPSKQTKEKKPKIERNVLVLGSGYVVAPCVEYLLRNKENHVTVASGHLANAVALKKKLGGKNVEAKEFDVKKQEDVDNLVKDCELVVSLIPWTYHANVIKAAIKFKKNVVTTSYLSPAMKELDAEAQEAGIFVLNEVGLDPGIDHFYALKTINEVHEQEGKVLSFLSYCGGLPAPEASNNPLGYKFSWSPRGVLLALCSTAKFLEDGKVVEIPGADLMKSAKPIPIYPAFAFEGYANRDSTPYDERYKIPECQTILRGTLRYAGNPSFMQAIIDCGFLNQEPREYLSATATPIAWKKVFAHVLGCDEDSSQEVLEKKIIEKTKISGETESRILKGFKWLGLFSEQPAPQKDTFLDSLATQLQSKMEYKEGERDMVMLQHKFEVELKDGTKETRTSTLLDYGIPNGTTSMAKLVGTPCGVAVQLVLNGEWEGKKGIFAPMTKDIYEPIMKVLEDENIVNVIEETL
eukprot:Lithocolla_globosa_v1_NODE_3626_length_1621_cov_8.644955.p1 type:complete len:472 gc:universal NODE_3626_length_1621_cov_8.644955:1575-160(-)